MEILTWQGFWPYMSVRLVVKTADVYCQDVSGKNFTPIYFSSQTDMDKHDWNSDQIRDQYISKMNSIVIFALVETSKD